MRLKLFGRFAGWWGGVASLYAATGGACPCCGRPGCPVGPMSAGALGLLCAAVMNGWQSRLSKQSTNEHDGAVPEAPPLQVEPLLHAAPGLVPAGEVAAL